MEITCKECGIGKCYPCLQAQNKINNEMRFEGAVTHRDEYKIFKGRDFVVDLNLKPVLLYDEDNGGWQDGYGRKIKM